MTRHSICILALSMMAIVGCGPLGSQTSKRGEETSALLELKSVGIAIILYARDNDGRTPVSLAELNPDYLDDSRFDHLVFTVPDIDIDTLTEECVILLATSPNQNNSEIRFLVCRANGSTELLIRNKRVQQ